MKLSVDQKLTSVMKRMGIKEVKKTKHYCIDPITGDKNHCYRLFYANIDKIYT